MLVALAFESRRKNKKKKSHLKVALEVEPEALEPTSENAFKYGLSRLLKFYAHRIGVLLKNKGFIHRQLLDLEFI
ncbi:MAG: hypothetical protein CMH44_03300 [Muricauda sp.]|nr:hypothetical protein [Allomuricauda sp.]